MPGPYSENSDTGCMRYRPSWRMPFNPDIHRRQSIRLHGYDYRSPGTYFITVCTRNRAQVLGHNASGTMHLSAIGRMVHAVWNDLDERYANFRTDEFIIMPDHIHGIIHVGAAPCGRPDRNDGQPRGVAPTGDLSLPDAVHRFKSLTAARYRNATSSGALWQRNYWDRIIRDDAELLAVSRYIRENPMRMHERGRR